MTYKIFKLPILISLFILPAACSTNQFHGQEVERSIIDDSDVVGMSRAELEAKIGSPSFASELSKNKAYYVYRVKKSRAGITSNIVKHDVVAITYDNNQKVKSVQLEENMGRDVSVAKKYTETKGTKSSIVQDFVKNFGKFNKSKRERHQR